MSNARQAGAVRKPINAANVRILYDGRVFQFQKAGGINRVFAEVISGLPTHFEPLVTGVEDFGKHVPCHPNLAQPCFKHFRPRRLSARVFDTWWKPRLIRSLDLFHPTYYDLTRGYSLKEFKCSVVLTVYDFIYAIYPSLLEGADVVINDQRDAIRRADFVICISKATENDLLERFPEKQGKTSVIYLASSYAIQPPAPTEALFEKPSFLFVGGRAGYKNFSFLLRAFAKAAQSNPGIRLRIAGAPLNSDERWQIHLLGIADRVKAIAYPDEQQLLNLYRSSVALVYPSLHEGFGIPPLEAMACRTLAITSNTSSLPEVVGDGGIMLNPTKEEDWVSCMLTAAKGNGDREVLIKRGVERVKRFSWKLAVDQHLKVYEEVSGRTRRF
jgi:glycosyltransferase involved in cell wall biosynthesis